ncbi:YeeE/YedE thiosulfate transporter family protein [Undibacterium griseum]|uniref:YeeE/YedE family protein n=1 Tax=Undibacterium griseum TaxID=2762295 RepID=A0ABR6YJM8_9BURK|nr:YeeE/YedE family protein [Undibacterium griseum]
MLTGTALSGLDYLPSLGSFPCTRKASRLQVRERYKKTARCAYSCNVGAFFSGVASTSLHGWLWIAAALPGNC